MKLWMTKIFYFNIFIMKSFELHYPLERRNRLHFRLRECIENWFYRQSAYRWIIADDCIEMATCNHQEPNWSVLLQNSAATITLKHS